MQRDRQTNPSHPEQSEGTFLARFLLAFLTRKSSPRRQDALRCPQNDRSVAAFTLAEVLITLGIIGVVAAMTIPTLIKNTQDMEYKAAWKKNYSRFAQAITLAINENGNSFGGMTKGSEYSISYELSNKILSNMNTIKICTAGNTIAEGCWHNVSDWYRIGGNTAPTTATVTNYGPSAMLKDGTLVLFKYISSATTSLTCSTDELNEDSYIDIDVNGFKKPNTIGKDIYRLKIFCNGRVQPAGVPGDYYDITSGFGCDVINADTRGYGCSARNLYN